MGRDPKDYQSPGDPWDAQHSLNKIEIATKDEKVSSIQSCSKESERIKPAFMNKGVVSQGTKNEKNHK